MFPGQPFQAHDIRAGFVRIAEQNGLLVCSGRVSDPSDLGRRSEIHRSAVNAGRMPRWGGHRQCENGCRKRASHSFHGSSPSRGVLSKNFTHYPGLNHTRGGPVLPRCHKNSLAQSNILLRINLLQAVTHRYRSQRRKSASGVNCQKILHIARSKLDQGCRN